MLIVILLIFVGVTYLLKTETKKRSMLSEMSNREIEECKNAYEYDIKDNVGMGRSIVDYKFSVKGQKYIDWLHKDNFNPNNDCRIICSGMLLVLMAYKFMSVETVENVSGYFLALIVSIFITIIIGMGLGTITSYIVKKLVHSRRNKDYWFICVMMCAGVVSLFSLL